MKNKSDALTGMLLLGFCGIAAYSVAQIPETTREVVGPASFPRLILILLTVCSAVLLIKSFVKPGPSQSKWPEPYVLRRIALFFGLFFLYLFSLVELGDVFLHMESPIVESGGAFSITTFLFLLVGLPLMGRRNKLEILLVAFGTTAVLMGVFAHGFDVILP